MAPATIEKVDRISGQRVDKFAERRAELAQAALQTLSELGYAKTSLREIAQNSIFSHGVLHYYFKDKVDLMTCCVRHYKAVCVTRYDEVVAGAKTYDELLEGFLTALSETVRNDAQMHRLWYDLRSQSLFEEEFRADVLEIDKSLENMIWRIMSRFSELTGEPQQMTPAVLYAVFDGLFQQCLLKHLAGDANAIAQMQADVRAVLARFAKKPLSPAKAVKAVAIKARTVAAKPKAPASKRATASRRARA
ncbi:MAG: TetR/AcrR family transcriptional regulator [Afipia sp.]